jgi:hypothetical protein
LNHHIPPNISTLTHLSSHHLLSLSFLTNSFNSPPRLHGKVVLLVLVFVGVGVGVGVGVVLVLVFFVLCWCWRSRLLFQFRCCFVLSVLCCVMLSCIIFVSESIVFSFFLQDFATITGCFDQHARKTCGTRGSTPCCQRHFCPVSPHHMSFCLRPLLSYA